MCYFSYNLRVVFRTRTVFPSVLPPQHSSALIYSFKCVWVLLYIGRTNERLDARIKHLPTKIRQENYFADPINDTYGSSIAEHLINNRDSASSYSADLFTILSRSHSDFHLEVLETIHILTINHPSVNRGNVYWALILLPFNIYLLAIFFLTLLCPFPLFVS